MFHLPENKIETEESLIKIFIRYSLIFLFCLAGSGCGPKTASRATLSVVATENFITDIAQNVAGSRATVSALVPSGIDPHDFQPSPKDLAVVTQSRMLIVNGAGLEGWMTQALNNIGGSRIVVTASQGMPGRTGGYGLGSPALTGTATAASTDPHFWMDPILVKTYVNNIRDGFIQLDPAGESIYRRNATAYSAQLDDLDQWIRSQVALIPAGQRLMVTDHEDLGYFADEYGFRLIGAITPETSSEAEPSASHIADLVTQIKVSGDKAIFLDIGTNTQLADQICAEAGCRVLRELYIHWLSSSSGPAATYLEMMRHNVTVIVEALR
ncbi:MAG: metal ABC transporter substrate-binding protein [Bacteroidota bacterium]